MSSYLFQREPFVSKHHKNHKKEEEKTAGARKEYRWSLVNMTLQSALHTGTLEAFSQTLIRSLWCCELGCCCSLVLQKRSSVISSTSNERRVLMIAKNRTTSSASLSIQFDNIGINTRGSADCWPVDSLTAATPSTVINGHFQLSASFYMAILKTPCALVRDLTLI